MTEKERKEMLDAMRSDKERSGSRKFWSPPSKSEGNFPVRFLPPLKKKDEVKFYFTHQTHWIDGISYECVDQTLVDKTGKEHSAEFCPVCQFTKKLYAVAERDSQEWKMAGQYNSKTRRVYRVVVRGNEDETIPVFYESGPKIFEKLFNILTETDFGNIIDLKEGRDFVINKVGTGRRSNYDDSMPAANSAPIFDDVEKIRAVMENAMKMEYNSLIEFRTAKDLKNLLNESLGLERKSEKSDENKEETADITNDAEIDESIESDESDESDDDEIDNIIAEFT